MSTASIESSITSNIYHLAQDENIDFATQGKFNGNISDSTIKIDGRKYRVIDDAIAVREKAISSWAQKWLLRTAGAIFAAGAVGALVIAATTSVGLLGLASIPAAVGSFFCFRSASNITDEDPHTIAKMRSKWNPNKQLHPFSSMYIKHDMKTEELKKFLTKNEISYAFGKQYTYSNFSSIIKDVNLKDAHQFFSSDKLQEMWKKELIFTSVDDFFTTYDKQSTCSLELMRNLEIISEDDWEAMKDTVQSFKKLDKHFTSQRREISNHETSILNQITETKDLKVRCAKLEHQQNFAVSMRRSMMLRHALSNRDTNDQNKLLSLGLDIGIIIAASAADRALEEKLVEARVEHEVDSTKVKEDFSKRYEALSKERLDQIQTLDSDMIRMIDTVKGQKQKLA